MSDWTIIAIFLPLSLISAGMIVYILRHDRHRRLSSDALFLLSMLFCWQFIQVLFHGTDNYEASFWLFDLDIPFVALMSLGALLFTMRFYSLERYRTPAVHALLLIIPCITFILALLPHSQQFLRTNLVITATHPEHMATYGRGFWFWIHAGYCYLVIVIACCIILVQYHCLPRAYRASSRLLIAGMLGSLVGNLIVVSAVFPADLDFSLIGCSVTGVFFFLAMHRNTGLDFLMQAREEVFSSLDKAVLILDVDGVVIGRNDKARLMQEKIGLPADERSYANIVSTMRAEARHFARDEEEIGMDYFFDIADGARAVNLREKRVTDRRGEHIATLITCTDVTRNRALIARLEDEAGLDALTGVMNRRAIEREQMLLDRPDSLPLGVIVGDVNDLRLVNEQMGRPQGDMALRLVADCLVSVCPPNARVARVSGDEFRVLLPGCDEAQLYDLLHRIRAAISRHPKNFQKIEIAMGIAVKMEPTDRLVNVILQADYHMRLEKEAMRGQKDPVREQGRIVFLRP